MTTNATGIDSRRATDPPAADRRPVVVVLGASGFVGSALVPRLADRAHSIRCVSRHPDRLDGPLPGRALRMRGDLLDPDSLDRVLGGADVVYYLAHALGESESFASIEQEGARNFARAARRAGIRHIVYLGALAQIGEEGCSQHISSRHRVGEILRESGVPVTEFRASIVIGAGSVAFEVVRALVERLPVMVTPRWVRMPIQPIAESDLLDYLVAALDRVALVAPLDRVAEPDPGRRAPEAAADASRVYEIGGAEVVDYARMMDAYANARGLRRRMIPVPVITPRLSSLWLKLVTPAHFQMGRRIVDSAEHSSVVVDPAAEAAFDVRPMGLDAAIERALAEERRRLDALEADDVVPAEGLQQVVAGSRFIERRAVDVEAPRPLCFEAIARIGGETGWYWGDWLWRLRGAMDRLVGGPGMRRGRPARRPLAAGDILDFWTVVRVDPGHRLTLRADMKLPGEALLDLRVLEVDGRCRIVQTASFEARGLPGLIYWYGLHPIHRPVFDGMLRGLVAAILRANVGASAPPPRPAGYRPSWPAAGGGRQ